MSTSVNYSQAHEVQTDWNGEIRYHAPGIQITFEWSPGRAARSLDAFDRAVSQVRSQIVDPAQEAKTTSSCRHLPQRISPRTIVVTVDGNPVAGTAPWCSACNDFVTTQEGS